MYSTENKISSVVSISGTIVKDSEILKEVQLTKLLLVEGSDEVHFLNEFVKELAIKDLEIRDYRGKNNFKNFFPIVVSQENFKRVKSLGIIRDTDCNNCNNGNIKNAFISIRDVLKKIKNDEEIKNRFKNAFLPDNNKEFSCGSPKIGIFIVNPMLENVCLQMVKDTKNMNCVESYFKCLHKNEIFQKNEYKAKILAFLASMPETTNCIGHAAEKNYWDFKSKCMDDIRKFVESL